MLVAMRRSVCGVWSSVPQPTAWSPLQPTAPSSSGDDCRPTPLSLYIVLAMGYGCFAVTCRLRCLQIHT